jgi:L-iditol 2-dehydrogenase
MTAKPTMLAAVLFGREDVRLAQVPVPTPAYGEVLVEIGAALTCGTDVKVYRRGYHAKMIKPPAIFGHEFAGTVVACGTGVEDFCTGDRVAAANSAPCGDCYYCRKNRPELCEDLLFLNGAYAQFISIPPRIVQKNLVKLPASLPFEHAALAEPLACVVRGMEAITVNPGDTAVVLGLGPIGLFFVRLLVLAGAQVIAVGRRPSRLALASALGAHVLVDIDTCSEAELPAKVKQLTEGGHGADIVVEAVGKPFAWEQAIEMARKAGTVSLFGGCPAETSISVSTHRLHYDEITLTATFHHTPAAFRRALDLLVSGEVPAQMFIQQRLALEALPGVLHALATGESDLVKCALLPQQRSVVNPG